MLQGGKNNKKKVHKLVILIDLDTLNKFLVREARILFYNLKEAFANIVSTYYFSLERKTKIEIDALGFTILGVLS